MLAVYVWLITGFGDVTALALLPKCVHVLARMSNKQTELFQVITGKSNVLYLHSNLRDILPAYFSLLRNDGAPYTEPLCIPRLATYVSPALSPAILSSRYG
jgi:hypothetical protein